MPWIQSPAVFEGEKKVERSTVFFAVDVCFFAFENLYLMLG